MPENGRSQIVNQMFVVCFGYYFAGEAWPYIETIMSSSDYAEVKIQVSWFDISEETTEN